MQKVPVLALAVAGMCSDTPYDACHYFLVFVTLRGTILSADMELTMLSMSTLTGMTGAPYGRVCTDPDLFLPFHSGELALSCWTAFACLDMGAPVVLRAFDDAVGGGLTEVACVDCVETVASVALLPLRSLLLARWHCVSTPDLNMLRLPSTPELTTRKS